MLDWIHDQCIPLVREITFQNGEVSPLWCCYADHMTHGRDHMMVTPRSQEMTEEGLPLLILFYHPDEPEIKEEYKEKVVSELAEFKGEGY